MKQRLCIDSIKLYLLEESVINDDDMVKLTVSAQLSRTDVIMNLRNIIRRRNVLDKFLKALKRSSCEDNNPGHKELFDMISKERERRLSLTSHEGDAPTPEVVMVKTTDGHHKTNDHEMERGDVATIPTHTAQHADIVVMDIEDTELMDIDDNYALALNKSQLIAVNDEEDSTVDQPVAQKLPRTHNNVSWQVVMLIHQVHCLLLHNYIIILHILVVTLVHDCKF